MLLFSSFFSYSNNFKVKEKLRLVGMRERERRNMYLIEKFHIKLFPECIFKSCVYMLVLTHSRIALDKFVITVLFGVVVVVQSLFSVVRHKILDCGKYFYEYV